MACALQRIEHPVRPTTLVRFWLESHIPVRDRRLNRRSAVGPNLDGHTVPWRQLAAALPNRFWIGNVPQDEIVQQSCVIDLAPEIRTRSKGFQFRRENESATDGRIIKR